MSAKVIISESLLMIPEISLVKAFRNLICGNEMNDLVPDVKSRSGKYIPGPWYLCGGSSDGRCLRMVKNLIILFLRFGASYGSGVGFYIRGKNLVFAGLGGMFTKAVYLLASDSIMHRFLYTMIASFAASVYGELMVRKRRRVPAVYFIYPSIIPLIPGDLFLYAICRACI